MYPAYALFSFEYNGINAVKDTMTQSILDSVASCDIIDENKRLALHCTNVN